MYVKCVSRNTLGCHVRTLRFYTWAMQMLKNGQDYKSSHYHIYKIGGVRFFSS